MVIQLNTGKLLPRFRAVPRICLQLHPERSVPVRIELGGVLSAADIKACEVLAIRLSSHKSISSRSINLNTSIISHKTICLDNNLSLRDGFLGTGLVVGVKRQCECWGHG